MFSFRYLNCVMVCCLMLCYVMVGCTLRMCECWGAVLSNFMVAIVFMAQSFSSVKLVKLKRDICLSCPCYLLLQSLLQLTRFESYYCCLAATAVVLAASVPAIAATAPADECFARSFRVRIKLSGPDVEIYLSFGFCYS